MSPNLGHYSVISFDGQGAFNRPIIVQNKPKTFISYAYGKANQPLTCCACNSDIKKHNMFRSSYAVQICNKGQEPVSIVNSKNGRPTGETLNPNEGYRILDKPCADAFLKTLVSKDNQVVHSSNSNINDIISKNKFFDKEKVAKQFEQEIDTPPSYNEVVNESSENLIDTK